MKKRVKGFWVNFREKSKEKIKQSKLGFFLIAFSYVLTLISVFVFIFKWFFPYHINIAILVYFSNWVIFFIGNYYFEKNYWSLIKKYKKIILFTILAIVIIYAIYVFLPIGKVEFLGMTKADLTEKIDADYKLMEVYVDGLESTMDQITENSEMFEIVDFNELEKSQQDLLMQLWADYLDYQVGVNKLIDDYKYFYQISYLKNKELHSKAFLIGYGSFVASYTNGIKLINFTITNPLFETILDDFSLEYGINAGSYSRVKYNVLHLNDVLRLTAGYGNYRFLYPEFEKAGLVEADSEIFSRIENSYLFSASAIKDESFIWFPLNAINIFKQKTYTLWFPIQKNVAKQMGNTRLTIRHENFITIGQIDEMKKKMQSGDILLERRNWYTSNIGIPGFWPHAALYLGNYNEFINFFDDPAVLDYVQSKGFANIDLMLGEINSDFYEEYKQGEKEIIEAIAPGVVLTDLHYSAKADYVAVLRPKISKLDKFKAIILAAENYGKEYDYNFNFITDSKLVCSELIYKAYRNIIELQLISHVGKMMIPANNFAKKFDEEYNSSNSEFDFVYFLDGNEEFQIANVEDVESFRKTWTRAKWDIAQE
jgi:hypothetical protein